MNARRRNFLESPKPEIGIRRFSVVGAIHCDARLEVSRPPLHRDDLGRSSDKLLVSYMALDRGPLDVAPCSIEAEALKSKPQ